MDHIHHSIRAAWKGHNIQWTWYLELSPPASFRSSTRAMQAVGSLSLGCKNIFEHCLLLLPSLCMCCRKWEPLGTSRGGSWQENWRGQCQRRLPKGSWMVEPLRSNHSPVAGEVHVLAHSDQVLPNQQVGHAARLLHHLVISLFRFHWTSPIGIFHQDVDYVAVIQLLNKNAEDPMYTFSSVWSEYEYQKKWLDKMEDSPQLDLLSYSLYTITFYFHLQPAIENLMGNTHLKPPHNITLCIR